MIIKSPTLSYLKEFPSLYKNKKRTSPIAGIIFGLVLCGSVYLLSLLIYFLLTKIK